MGRFYSASAKLKNTFLSRGKGRGAGVHMPWHCPPLSSAGGGRSCHSYRIKSVSFCAWQSRGPGKTAFIMGAFNAEYPSIITFKS